jgi:predicted AAA+ superfamily ATPase
VQRLPGLETSELRRLRHAKLHATDPGLVAAFASSADPLAESRTLGRILEAAVLRHLREVARNANGRMLYVQLHSTAGSKRGEVDFLLLTAREAFFVEVTGSSAGPDKTRALLAHVAAYRGHGKARNQLGGRKAFALVVTGETVEADGQASAAHFLDRVLEAPPDDPCQTLRTMSTGVAT